jgi:hypothetical protein
MEYERGDKRELSGPSKITLTIKKENKEYHKKETTDGNNVINHSFHSSIKGMYNWVTSAFS